MNGAEAPPEQRASIASRLDGFHRRRAARGQVSVHLAVPRANRRLHSRAGEPVVFCVGPDPYPAHLLPR